MDIGLIQDIRNRDDYRRGFNLNSSHLELLKNSPEDIPIISLVRNFNQKVRYDLGHSFVTRFGEHFAKLQIGWLNTEFYS